MPVIGVISGNHILKVGRHTAGYDQTRLNRAAGRCYNTGMNRTFRPIHTGSDADIAFAVLVLASYFSTFSSRQSATSSELLLMIGLGVAYIAMGIYGYAYVT